MVPWIQLIRIPGKERYCAKELTALWRSKEAQRIIRNTMSTANIVDCARWEGTDHSSPPAPASSIAYATVSALAMKNVYTESKGGREGSVGRWGQSERGWVGKL